MKTMIITDFAVLRTSLLQLAGICLVIALFMGFAMESVIGAVAAIGAMVPFMILFSLAAVDEQNGWERFRLTLPITRRAVVFGRYASVGLVALVATAFSLLVAFLILALVSVLPANMLPAGLTVENNPPAMILGAAIGSVSVVMVGAAVALPLIMRFGMTRATRFVPVVVVIATAAAVSFFGSSASSLTGPLGNIVQWLDTGNNYLILGGGIILAVLALYVLSACIAAKLYEQREF